MALELLQQNVRDSVCSSRRNFPVQNQVCYASDQLQPGHQQLIFAVYNTIAEGRRTENDELVILLHAFLKVYSVSIAKTSDWIEMFNS